MQPTKENINSAGAGTTGQSLSDMKSSINSSNFIDIEGERFVCIEQLEKIPTFFLSMISASDHWLFTGSNGALSAGRGSPDSALFPYYTVDKILDNWNCSGPQTIILCGSQRWEPFKPDNSARFETARRICKSLNGDIILFEETNHSLDLTFRFTWRSTEKYGFVRTSRIINHGPEATQIRVADGLADIMPAGIDDRTQQAYSCLVDGYRLSELDADKQLLVHRMAASLVDEAIPLECLHATTVWSNGWPESSIVTRFEDVDKYLQDSSLETPEITRATRGAFLNVGDLFIQPGATKEWSQVANINQDQSDVAALSEELSTSSETWEAVLDNINEGRLLLNKLIAATDGQQITEEEIVTTHHRANALFNIMRGGVFADGYNVKTALLKKYISQHTKTLPATDQDWLDTLPPETTHAELVSKSAHASERLQRLCLEYLPLVFSRRHGDPSRPWNRFNICTKDAQGDPVVGFQGNWRDIFQNWEALAYSFPNYNQSFIYKFLNASTADGYNPYRITDKGIDWEEPDENDPWASIGYWGDHQIIYLLKLLEFSSNLNHQSLREKLRDRSFVFADVPYEIKGFSELALDPNHSINFNHERNKRIAERTQKIGAEGKLVQDAEGKLQTASLLEKLLLPLLTKLSNFVPGGGIWMNTQRPEWNDANNALAGNGLSMVTTAYLHRYLVFLENLLKDESADFTCFAALANFFNEVASAFQDTPEASTADDKLRYAKVETLGLAGERYRDSIYKEAYGKEITLKAADVKAFLANSRAHVAHTIAENRRPDALYHAYNILHIQSGEKSAAVQNLGVMLEGQVAVLSSKAITPLQAQQSLQALKASELYCPKRNSYILYADKSLPTFLQFNRVKKEAAQAIPLVAFLLENKDQRLLNSSKDNCLRFNPSIRNRFELDTELDKLAAEPKLEGLIANDRNAIQELYESTFQHHSFTGRSGSMFAYEGLGCIYWHMVSKLMLAIQEITLEATNPADLKTLSNYYYDIQGGLGFRRTATQYGAFTADAYSHTPAHAGAQQPGLTGMVKEGLLCRFGELGIKITGQIISFKPALIKETELLKAATTSEIIRSDGLKKAYTLPEDSLLFTLVQIPVIYVRTSRKAPVTQIYFNNGTSQEIESDTLPADLSAGILNRNSTIDYIQVEQPAERFLSL
jgi:hypothetical protein